ncbi:MAG: 23S rRNA (uracil(1939)-C(5))-methyltransferase RlmD [Bacteroidetes bacterium]|nr:23S rRNA (uracil(1939)-C(5))-methyltransferase RlmD [Bacteroidota bacterium]
MAKFKQYGSVFEKLEILRAGAEGHCICKIEDRVVFVKHVVPGDICDIKIIGRKKKAWFGELVHLHQAGPGRTEAFCEHFGTCGGCKWQHMDYPHQLESKRIQVRDAMQRIGKLEVADADVLPTLGSASTTFYRNKLEYAFSDNRWLEYAKIQGEEFVTEPGLGFHIPMRFDKILHINRCWLQTDPSNAIRNFCYDWALKSGLPFYNPRSQTGFYRNIMLRNTRSGDWMVLLTFQHDHPSIAEMLTALQNQFPEIKSLLFAINGKVNDSIYDLDMQLFSGEDYLMETLNDLSFRIRPKSFFQTNPNQAEVLYQTAMDFANIQPNDVVYDFYCGTGTLTLLAARSAKEVVGVESVPQAIQDANENAERNQISNTHFIVGDMKSVFTDDFSAHYGKPDIIITDPPRAGMHADVVNQLNQSGARRIVYVSCNPATQARDLELMKEFYSVENIQPVDMFPHTHHVECVVSLVRRG